MSQLQVKVMLNQSVEPTGGSRFSQGVLLRQWRLPPVAHALRSAEAVGRWVGVDQGALWMFAPLRTWRPLRAAESEILTQRAPRTRRIEPELVSRFLSFEHDSWFAENRLSRQPPRSLFGVGVDSSAFREKLGALLTQSRSVAFDVLLGKLNRLLRGWGNYQPVQPCVEGVRQGGSLPAARHLALD